MAFEVATYTLSKIVFICLLLILTCSIQRCPPSSRTGVFTMYVLQDHTRTLHVTDPLKSDRFPKGGASLVAIEILRCHAVFCRTMAKSNLVTL